MFVAQSRARRFAVGTAVLALVVASGGTATTMAQDGGRDSGRPSSYTVDLDFAGGSVLDYVSHLGEGANIVISDVELLEELPLGEVHVSDVTVPTALTLLRNRTWHLDDGRKVQTTFSTSLADPPIGRPIYTIQTEVSMPRDPGTAAANLLTFEFDGGPLQEYLGYIERASGVNILVSKVAADLELPAVSLKRVSPHSAVYLLEGQRFETSQGVYELDLDMIGGRGDEAMLYRIDADSKSRVSVAQPVPTATHSWSIADLLHGGLKPEEILTAIETVIELTPGGDNEPQIRFHEATGLIMVRGTTEHLSAIDDALDEMTRTVAFRQGAGSNNGGN